MSRDEMLALLVERTGESEEVLTSFLDEAGDIIINRVYPFRYDVEEVPTKYQRRQIEIAVYLVNKRGAEGETKHDENGTNRSYESASVPESMLRDIMPYCKIPSAEDEEDENA